jgi:hypothetical protein
VEFTIRLAKQLSESKLPDTIAAAGRLNPLTI